MVNKRTLLYDKDFNIFSKFLLSASLYSIIQYKIEEKFA